MRLSWRARRRWSIAVLLLALPTYVVAAVNLVQLFDRPPIWAEFLLYAGLGILWTLPLRAVFLGIGKPDPDAAPPGAR